VLRAVEALEKVSGSVAVLDEELQRASAHLQKEGTDYLTPQADYLSGATVTVEEQG